jgi:drug/metabolite transporter (DMT)-like permease
MAKILLILVIAAVLENIGVVFIKGGLNQIHRPSQITASEVVRVVRAGATNHRIILGIALEAAFFGCFLYMLSQRDVSLIWPLTSLGFIVAALAAKFILGETVSGVRWAGVILIAAGAVLTSYSEAVKTNQNPPPQAPILAVPPADAR